MNYLKNKEFIFSFVVSFMLLAIALAVNSFAVVYASKSISNPVTDIVLSNTRVYDVDGIFVYGAVLLVLIIILVCCLKLQRTPFIVKSIAVFVLIRSFFLSLTHISPYPAHVAITSSLFTRLFPSVFTGDDLFFSGHVGLPFLLALIFWEHPFWRNIFLGFSILFAIVVLLGHLHYSIDVASAFFITYTIFVIVKKLFRKDLDRYGV